MAGTSEGTVVQFQFLSSNVDQDNKDWVRTRTFKNHSHDVRALVHLESAVVSGGRSVHVLSWRTRAWRSRASRLFDVSRYGHPAGHPPPAGQSGEEHPRVSAAQNNLPPRESPPPG